MGDQNLLAQFEKLAQNPNMQYSIAKMQYKLKNGEADLQPKDFLHVKAITKILNKAKKKAWAQVKKEEDVQELIRKEKNYKKRRKNVSGETIKEIVNMRK